MRSRGGGGGIVSQAIAIAEVTIQNNPDEYSCYRDLDLHNSYWAQSLFRRMGFRRRTATTGEVDVPPQKNLLEEVTVTWEDEAGNEDFFPFSLFNLQKLGGGGQDFQKIGRPVGGSTISDKGGRGV